MGHNFEINGDEYLTIKEAADILDETYFTTYKKLDKFKRFNIGSLIFVDKNSVYDYKMWKNKYKQQ